MMNIAANAYQVNNSLLAGNNVSSTYTKTNTVALNYGITGNQSAKIYANQSILTTVGGWDNSDNLKRGEFTPFNKGEENHLCKGQKSAIFQGLIGVTTRDRIEFFESIKGKVIEFLESIKKGSIFATLPCQFFGSMPNLSSSLRQAVLTHALNGSSPITEFICSSKSSSNRIVLLVLFERSYGFLSFSSCIGSNHYDSLYAYGANQYKGKCYKKTMPRSASTLTGHLITTDTYSIEVTMSKHNTPVTGRNSITPNHSYRWLFLALNRSDYTAKPCRIAVTAPNEHDARLMLVRDYMLIFAGRLPTQEVTA